MASTESTGHAAPRGTIRRVWLWQQGAIPAAAIEDPDHHWWSDRQALGMTDYVVSLNDHGFPAGRLGIRDRYTSPPDTGGWHPILQILSTLDRMGISPHLMVFLRPDPDMIGEAAASVADIVRQSGAVPRSIQLDLEGWWHGEPAARRAAGEAAVRRYFFDEWSADRPDLGIGVTHLASVPAGVAGALALADFAIPQMYGSERNYRTADPAHVQEEIVQRHFRRTAEALGAGKKRIVAGQSANSHVNSPDVIRQMVRAILAQHHPNVGTVDELAFWSDHHVLANAAMKAFFTRLTSLVRDGGLGPANVDEL